jgi:hypothetical protein
MHPVNPLYLYYKLIFYEMKQLFSALCSMILFPGLLIAQHQNVIIGSSQGYGFPGEPAVCMNPANPDEILVGAMPDNFYTSTDGGYSWEQGILSSQWGVQADPVILCDASGRFYYLHLPIVIERVVCHRRDQITAPWSLESNAAFNGNHDVDKEWAAFDPVNDRIYLSWTYFDTWGSSNPGDSSCIYLSWSEDGGQTWMEPVRISDEKGNAQGGNYSMHGSYPTTGPNGEVYIAWWGPDGLMFDRSLDMGTTWLPEDICITGQNINWIYNIPGVNLGVTFPVIACDRSGGPDLGTIYITWADQRNGYNDTDIFIVKSDDEGISWSAPIRVNDDGPDKHQFFPFVTVDQESGKVWLVFYDRRNYTDTNTDVFMAVSENGGQTFENFRVSETPFIPYSTVFHGHYIGLTAHDDHVFPVWMRMNEGETTIMGALVDPQIIGREEFSGSPAAYLESGPNPFTETTFISIKLKEPVLISLSVYDITGKQISTLVDNIHYPAGKHVIKIDASSLRLRPDVYFARLETGIKHATTRLVMIN